MSTPNESQPKPVPADPELVVFVSGELKRGAATADVIYEVCRRADVQWPEAEAFVRPFAQQRQSQRRHKPKPIVGLTVFLGLAALVVGIGVGVAKGIIDHRTITPIIYEAATPTDVSSGKSLYRHSWVEAGQTITIDYDLNVKSGRVTLIVGQEWSSSTSKGVYDMAREDQYHTLKQTGRGQIQYPVTDTGWYQTRVGLSDFAGRCEITWDVR
jgi:hypothetical protein